MVPLFSSGCVGSFFPPREYAVKEAAGKNCIVVLWSQGGGGGWEVGGRGICCSKPGREALLTPEVAFMDIDRASHYTRRLNILPSPL